MTDSAATPLGLPPRERARGRASLNAPLTLTSLLLLALSATHARAASERDTMVEAVETACLEMGNSSCRLQSLERRVVIDDLAEYTFLIRVGEGPLDVIGLHRVVQETGPWRPAALRDSLFLIHGDAWGFSGAFHLNVATSSGPAPVPPATWLADRGVDVWGIDLRWVNVPSSETDLGSMAGWDTALHVTDTRTAVKVARHARADVDGGAPLMLLGWSRGAQLAYAYAGLETGLEPSARDLRGLIPVDYALLFDPVDEEARAAACARYERYQAQIDAGVHHTPQGSFLRSLGNLATSAPDQRSPFSGLFGVPDYSNLQMALYFGSRTFAFYDATPSYHYTGGLFDTSGKPTGLAFTPRDTFITFLKMASSYQSLGELRDGEALLCGSDTLLEALPYEDGLAEITLPVLHVSAGGGFGAYGDYTGIRLERADVTWLELSELETADLDFGHTDLWQGIDADERVWAPLLEWVQRH